MPNNWDAGVYHNRAQAWLQKAESLPEGRERKACFALAKDYARLAKLLEVQQKTAPSWGVA